MVDARVNPIMLKEVYQAFRSRALVIGALIALFAPLSTYMILLSTGTEWLGNSPGQAFFMIVAGFIAIVTCVIIPTAVGMQLQNEARTRTLELIALTALSPWEIASGRFQAGLLQILLVFSYTGPFAVAALAMDGISSARVLGSLLFVFALSMLQCAAALVQATIVLWNARLRGLGWIGFALQAFVFALIAAGVSEGASGIPLVVALWAVASVLAMTGFYLRLTADALTPPGVRCYARSKLALLLLLLVWLAPGASDDFRHESLVALAMSGLCYFYLFAVLWAASRAGATGETRFPFPLRNGYAATLAYAVIVSALLSGLLLAIEDVRGGSGLHWTFRWAPAIMLVYYVFFSGLGAMVHSLLSRDFRGAASQFGIVLVLVVLDLSLSGIVQASLLRGDALPDSPPPWLVFLPLSLGGWHWAMPWPWYAAPLAVGFGGVAFARARRARLADG